MSVDPCSYADDYYEDQELAQELNAAYQQDLESLGTQDCYSGLVTIMIMTMSMVIMWYGLQMKMAADTMNALSAMQADVNTIESDYNNFVQLYNDEAMAYVEDAVNAGKDLMTIAQTDPAIYNSSIYDDLLTQMGTIMGSDDPDEWTTQSVESYWAFSASAYSGDKDPDSATNGGSEDVQPIENAFTAIHSDLDNLSSTQQSTAQYYSSCQQQIEGTDETIMEGYASEEQTMVNNQVTA